MPTKFYYKCLRCGRKLKSEESKQIGFGKTCYKKYMSEDNRKQLFHVSELSNNNKEEV